MIRFLLIVGYSAVISVGFEEKVVLRHSAEPITKLVTGKLPPWPEHLTVSPSVTNSDIPTETASSRISSNQNHTTSILPNTISPVTTQIEQKVSDSVTVPTPQGNQETRGSTLASIAPTQGSRLLVFTKRRSPFRKKVTTPRSITTTTKPRHVWTTAPRKIIGQKANGRSRTSPPDPFQFGLPIVSTFRGKLLNQNSTPTPAEKVERKNSGGSNSALKSNKRRSRNRNSGKIVSTPTPKRATKTSKKSTSTTKRRISKSRPGITASRGGSTNRPPTAPAAVNRQTTALPKVRTSVVPRKLQSMATKRQPPRTEKVKHNDGSRKGNKRGNTSFVRFASRSPTEGKQQTPRIVTGIPQKRNKAPKLITARPIRNRQAFGQSKPAERQSRERQSVAVPPTFRRTTQKHKRSTLVSIRRRRTTLTPISRNLHGLVTQVPERQTATQIPNRRIVAPNSERRSSPAPFRRTRTTIVPQHWLLRTPSPAINPSNFVIRNRVKTPLSRPTIVPQHWLLRTPSPGAHQSNFAIRNRAGIPFSSANRRPTDFGGNGFNLNSNFASDSNPSRYSQPPRRALSNSLSSKTKRRRFIELPTAHPVQIGARSPNLVPGWPQISSHKIPPRESVRIVPGRISRTSESGIRRSGQAGRNRTREADGSHSQLQNRPPNRNKPFVISRTIPRRSSDRIIPGQINRGEVLDPVPIRTRGQRWRVVPVVPHKVVHQRRIQPSRGRHRHGLISRAVLKNPQSRQKITVVNLSRNNSERIFGLPRSWFLDAVSNSDAQKLAEGQLVPSFSWWSDWGPCTATCGSGFKARQRQCRPVELCPTPNGEEVETSPCFLTPCLKESTRDEWSTWSGWSECSASCGTGIKERMRSCVAGRRCQQSPVIRQTIRCSNTCL